MSRARGVNKTLSVSNGCCAAAPSWLHLIPIFTSPHSYSLLSWRGGDTPHSHHQSSEPVPCHPAGRGAVLRAIVLFCFVCCITLALFLVPKVSWVGLALIKAPQRFRWIFTLTGSDPPVKLSKANRLPLPLNVSRDGRFISGSEEHICDWRAPFKKRIVWWQWRSQKPLVSLGSRKSSQNHYIHQNQQTAENSAQVTVPITTLTYQPL